MVTISHHWPFLQVRREPLSSPAIGWIALLISIACGSTFNGFAKILTTALSPLSILLLSEIVTWLSVIFTFGFLPTISKLLNVERREILPLLSIGVCSGLIGPLLWFSGLELTEAVNASFFGKMEAVFLIILAHTVLRECFSRGHALASITIVAGVITIIFRGFSETLTLQSGDTLILIAAFSYACGNIIFRRFLTNVAPEVVLLTRTSTAIAAFFIATPFLSHPFTEELYAFPVALIPVAIGFGFLSRFLNSFSFYEAIERLPVSTVSLVSTVEVLGGVIFAYFFVGEYIHWYHILGGAFILLGTVILELAGNACPTKPATLPTAAVMKE